MDKIKIGIVGYGNLGQGVEVGLKNHPDMELVGIFSRRDPKTLNTQTPAYLLQDILNFKDKIDVLILCEGSKMVVPKHRSSLIDHFDTAYAYDIHAEIPKYYNKMFLFAKVDQKVALISTGWDPGLFSMNRLMQEAILPDGKSY